MQPFNFATIVLDELIKLLDTCSLFFRVGFWSLFFFLVCDGLELSSQVFSFFDSEVLLSLQPDFSLSVNVTGTTHILHTMVLSSRLSQSRFQYYDPFVSSSEFWLNGTEFLC